MSAISETIVREYFELHGFYVRQQGKSVMPNRRDEEEIDFLIINPRPRASRDPLPFILSSADLPGLLRAAVAVKPRHTDNLSPTLLGNAPEIYRLGEPKVFETAARNFSSKELPLKILVIPALPADESLRQHSVRFLREKGIDAVITFQTILSDLVASLDPHRNYEKSDLLQTIRILKNYDFIKDPQLELFKPARRRKSKRPGAAPGIRCEDPTNGLPHTGNRNGSTRTSRGPPHDRG